MTDRTPTTAAGRALVESARQRSSLTWRDTPNHVALVAKTVEQTTTMVLAIEAEVRAPLDVEMTDRTRTPATRWYPTDCADHYIAGYKAGARASLDVERLAVVAAARALRERLTIDPGNVVSWGEWDTLDEALAKLGAKP